MLLAAAAIAACAESNPATMPANVRATAEAIDSARLASDAAYLSSDALRGRATPSPGLDTAGAYIVRRLTQLGVKPAGDSGGFWQRYAVREVHRDTMNAWVEFGGRRFREGADFLVLSFGGPATVTAPMTYVGHGIRAPKKHIDPFAGVTLKGRIAVAHGPNVFPKGESFQSLGALGADWDIAQHLAPQEGALAVLLINSPRMLALWARPMFRNFGRQSRELASNPPGMWASTSSPTLWIKPEMAGALFAHANGPAVLSKGAEGDFVPSFDLAAAQTATIHIGTPPAAIVRPGNIIAIVEGRDRTLRNEYVMLGAHLDGAVDGIPAPGDSIFNAADDNASGSAALLSIAEAMMRGPRPRRSVIFMWDTGEEVGLWGSRHFATHSPVPLDRIVTYFNVDMIGRSKKPGSSVEGEEALAGPDEIFIVGPRVLSTTLDSLLERTSRDYLGVGLNHKFDRADHEFFFPRTDAAPLMEHGVLAVEVMNGEHGDYHGAGDVSSKLDLRRMHRVTKTIYASVWMLAERRERPAMDKGMPATVKQYR
jgi:hypothetical protein